MSLLLYILLAILISRVVFAILVIIELNNLYKHELNLSKDLLFERIDKFQKNFSKNNFTNFKINCVNCITFFKEHLELQNKSTYHKYISINTFLISMISPYFNPTNFII